MGKLFWVCLFALTMVTQSVFADYVFMPIGDSITSGFHGTPAGNYRDIMQSQLDRAGVEYDFVGQYKLGFLDKDHQGLAGADIAYMTNNWGRVVGRYQPDFALVLAGTNDHWSPPNFAAFYTLYDNLVNMIQTNSPHTSIIISTVPRFGYGGPPGANYWSNAWVNNRNSVVFPNMNAAIRAVAANHKNVTVVDFYSALSIKTDLASDGIHPNLYGQQKLAKLFGDEALRQISSPPILDPSDSRRRGPMSNPIDISAIPEPTCGLLGWLSAMVMGIRRPSRRQ